MHTPLDSYDCVCIQGEIDTRQSVFEEVLAFGKNLVTSGHYASEEVQNTMQTLQAEREKILQTWQERKNEHTQVSSWYRGPWYSRVRMTS